MTAKERNLQDDLMCWPYTLNRISVLENQLAEMQTSITTNYDLSGVTVYGGKSSKIENLYIQKSKKEQELKKLVKLVAVVEGALRGIEFSMLEKETLRCLMYGPSLKVYAEQKGIYKSYIYKIKDKAIRKLSQKLKD